ncbi:hypothetical protein ACHWQZ_G013271 [Mnemiopsis leidyi]
MPKENRKKTDESPVSSTTRLLPTNDQLTFTKRVAIFSVAVFGVFSVCLYYTVPMSFLANEIIEKRKFSSTTAGVVFSSQCLSLFFSLIAAPKTASLFSIRQASLISIISSILSTVFYLAKLDDTSWLVYSIISRILQGLAVGIIEVRFLDMMTQCFPDNLALISSAYELPYCFCSMVGFEMGGLMYEMFGFWAPLNLTTVLVVVSCIGAYFCSYWLPENEDDDVSAAINDVVYWPIMMISFFGMGIISITDAIAESFYCYYMLNRFGLSEIKSGGMLTVSSIIYTITTFISGCIGSRQKNLKYLLLGGLILMGTSACLLGEDIPIFNTMGVYFPATMLCLLQAGSGLAQVAALPLMVMQYEKRTGLPENLASSHMGGIYSSYFFLGSFLGPLAGGYVIDITSYGFICTICGILLLVSFQIMMGLQLAKKQFLNP